MPASHDSPSGTAASDRRGARRLELVSPLVGQDENGEEVGLVNVSDSGLLVHTAQLATAGDVRHFRFPVTSDGILTRFSARVVHVMRISGAQGASYALGLQFTSPLPDETRAALRRLVTPPA
jgi:hypothetical protein